MRDGQILAQGTPAEVITEKVIAGTFGISSLIYRTGQVIPPPYSTVSSYPVGRPSRMTNLVSRKCGSQSGGDRPDRLTSRSSRPSARNRSSTACRLC